MSKTPAEVHTAIIEVARQIDDIIVAKAKELGFDDRETWLMHNRVINLIFVNVNRIRLGPVVRSPVPPTDSN